MSKHTTETRPIYEVTNVDGIEGLDGTRIGYVKTVHDHRADGHYYVAEVAVRYVDGECSPFSPDEEELDGWHYLETHRFTTATAHDTITAAVSAVFKHYDEYDNSEPGGWKTAGRRQSKPGGDPVSTVGEFMATESGGIQ